MNFNLILRPMFYFSVMICQQLMFPAVLKNGHELIQLVLREDKLTHLVFD